MVEARSAKQRVETQLRGVPGVSLGIGETDNGSDYAVVVLVEDEQTARRLPAISSEVPVTIMRSVSMCSFAALVLSQLNAQRASCTAAGALAWPANRYCTVTTEMPSLRKPLKPSAVCGGAPRAQAPPWK